MFGYIKRHWRGELSLPQSYWVNGVLVGLPFNIYFRVLAEAFAETPPQSPSVYFYYALLPLAFAVVLAIWQLVGIWRSAGHRIAEGQYGWAWIARLVVLGNFIYLAATLAMNGMANYAMFRAFLDERAARYEIHAYDTYVVFHGVVTDASATELITALSSPKIGRLLINGSAGGFVQPSLRIAKVIHDRSLWVSALGECDSSCTGLLAAGHTRAITPDTIIGLHRGTLAATDKTALGWSKIEDYYRLAGMTPALFAKMRAHEGPYDLYYPKVRELIAGGFITDIYQKSVTGYVPAGDWCARNADACNRTGADNAVREKQK